MKFVKVKHDSCGSEADQSRQQLRPLAYEKISAVAVYALNPPLD